MRQGCTKNLFQDEGGGLNSVQIISKYMKVVYLLKKNVNYNGGGGVTFPSPLERKREIGAHISVKSELGLISGTSIGLHLILSGTISDCYYYCKSTN